MTYDHWKSTEPDDGYDDLPPDECDHDDYELDILTGRATCSYCDHHWYPSDETIAAEIQRQADYMAEMEAEAGMPAKPATS